DHLGPPPLHGHADVVGGAAGRLRRCARVRDRRAAREVVGPGMNELRTLRLRLEPLEERHAIVLFEGLRNAELYEYLDEPPPQSPRARRGRYRGLEHGRSPEGLGAGLTWAVRLPATGRYVGSVQATARRDDSADLAYVLFRDAWGHGFAREAVGAVIDHLQRQRATTLFRATVDARNVRSIALLEALSFERAAGGGDANSVRQGRSADLVFRRLVPPA